MFKPNKKEILLKYLLKKFDNSKNNRVTFSLNDLKQIHLTEQDVIHAIYTLETN